MKPKGKRNLKIADLIREKIALLIPRTIHDSDLGFVTITSVELSGDERTAWVFYTVIGEGDQHRKTAETLADAAGQLRRELGRSLHVRHVPELVFQPDPTSGLGLDHVPPGHDPDAC